jgi:hypothetical protein
VLRSLFRGAEQNWREFHRCHAATKQNRSYGISSGFVSITLPFVPTHHRFGTGWMLQTDALSAVLFVVAALFVLHKINAARAQGLAADNSRVG